MTAINHGLEEEAKELFDHLPVDKETGEKIVPQANPNARLFAPPPPIMHTDSNWPLLTVSKGFFDGVASARTAAEGVAVTAKASAMDMEEDDLEGGAEGGWGDDDGLGGEDDDSEGEKKDGEEGEGGGWDVSDDDLELPPDVESGVDKAAAADDGYVTGGVVKVLLRILRNVTLLY